MPTTQEVTVVVTAASSTPLAGTTTNDLNTPAFTPQLGRDMYLTLAGTWTGTVQVTRSTDGGTNYRPITIGGGQLWGNYTGNCDEVVDTPTDSHGIYRLEIDIASGSLTYRLGQ